jgi:AcrR family transcriptional regulator
VIAALELFSEQGYDETTVAQIAERAGLTKSTFFRHFPDKRDVLSAGQEEMSRLLAEGITDAPADATPMDAVAAGLRRVATMMGPDNREIAPRIDAVVAASVELQERHALKQVGLAAAMSQALQAREVDEAAASVAAELGALAFKQGFAEWVASDGERDLGALSVAALGRLRAGVAALA